MTTLLLKVLLLFKQALQANSGISSKRIALCYLLLLYGFVVIYSIFKDKTIDNTIYYSLEILIVSCIGGMAIDNYQQLKPPKS